MEPDDLDNLIADSLAGVQSALEGDRSKAAAEPAQRSAAEAVRELQAGPARTDGQPPGEEFFTNLVKTFQDEGFQKAMADAMQVEPSGSDAKPASGAAAALTPASAEASAPASSSSSAAASADGVEAFMQNFMKSFDGAVSPNSDFESKLSGLMTSMLSKDLICEPMQQIADALEPWLKGKKGLPKAERERYEAQLRMYKSILGVYQQNSDPLPESAHEQVQKMLNQLHQLGQPPDEVMAQIQPAMAEEGTESFEDFMKKMDLNSSLGSAEQDLLKKLTDDPEELTKVMQDMAGDEACKQQ